MLMIYCRYRLARASVTVNDSGSDSEAQKEVIPLLCSIFLANRGDTELSGEENDQPWVRNMTGHS